jgi:hypothetical protein
MLTSPASLSGIARSSLLLEFVAYRNAVPFTHYPSVYEVIVT